MNQQTDSYGTDNIGEWPPTVGCQLVASNVLLPDTFGADWFVPMAASNSCPG